MSHAEPLTAARSLRELIESEAVLIEQSNTMTPKVVDALVESGLFRLLVPREFEGLEADPATIIDVCEELSYADGSVGWALGVAKRALDEIAAIAKGGRTRLGSLPLREQPISQRDFGFHTEALKAARLLANHAYTSAVESVARGDARELREDRLRATKSAASYITHVARAAVTFAWQSSGSVGMRNPSRLQRCFRDMIVGAGHQVFDDRNFNEVAKTYLDLEPSFF